MEQCFTEQNMYFTVSRTMFHCTYMSFTVDRTGFTKKITCFSLSIEQCFTLKKTCLSLLREQCSTSHNRSFNVNIPVFHYTLTRLLLSSEQCFTAHNTSFTVYRHPTMSDVRYDMSNVTCHMSHVFD